jgi:hypothetical protein
MGETAPSSRICVKESALLDRDRSFAWEASGAMVPTCPDRVSARSPRSRGLRRGVEAPRRVH